MLEEVYKALIFILMLYLHLVIAIILQSVILLILTWSLHYALLPFGINTKKLGELDEINKG